MSDAAHGELLKHPVYSHPNNVEPVFEMWDTPADYREYPGGENLPNKLQVWRVQNSGREYGSVVGRSFGFTDSPDAEIIARGYNNGKEYGAVGVGRHGNFLQWGYSSSPSQMTEAGRRLFVNCIYYISQFDGRTPLVRVTSSERTNSLILAAIILRVVDDKKDFFLGTFPAELYEKYGQDPEGLVSLYRSHIDLVYRDKLYRIDAELQSLGLKSNRTMDTLEKLIGFLNDQDKKSMAQVLLKRYTNETFSTHEEWQRWLNENRNRIYFSDVAGYKFLVVPEGYLDWPK